MRRLILSMLLVLPLAVFGQKGYQYKGIKNFPVSEQTGKVAYDSVVAVEGKTAEQLYNAAKEWLARTYGDSKEVIQVDQPNDKIIGKGVFRDTDGTHLSYVFLLEFKDGRYKYEVTDFIYQNSRTSLENDANSTKGNFRFYDRGYAALNLLLSKTALAFSSIAQSSTNNDW